MLFSDFFSGDKYGAMFNDLCVKHAMSLWFTMPVKSILFKFTQRDFNY